MRIVYKHFSTLLLILLITSNSYAGGLTGWGVVILPGKDGNASQMSSVANEMSAHGALIFNNNVSWSNGYLTYDQTLDEVGSYIRQLKSKGAKKIAIVGQSLGTNIALAYSNLKGGVNAVVAMAPGHRPEKWVKYTYDSLNKAKEMIKAGKGKDTASFNDLNQGRQFQTETTAEAYLSFFDPNGKAVMSKNIRAGGAKLLWIIGTQDQGAQEVARGGKIIMIDANHGSTPKVGAHQAVEWLESQ